MNALHVLPLFLAGAAATAPADARPYPVPASPGPLVSVAVEIDGETTPLYPAPDGSGRFYLEAREGRSYSLTLANRSAGRVGVVLAVDGLNAISGGREDGRGRMYVLDPWQRIAIRGWRTSLEEVRRFTFVDERHSYAARSGKANRKMGWIEVSVYRERDGALVQATPPVAPGWLEPFDSRTEPAPDGESAGPSARLKGAPSAAGKAERSYPGTGWGGRAHDPARLVDFDPELHPAETVTLRYEYRPALVALGVLPPRWPADRLRQRDRAQPGFALPPPW